MQTTQALVRVIRRLDRNADLDGITHDEEALWELFAVLASDFEGEQCDLCSVVLCDDDGAVGAPYGVTLCDHCAGILDLS